MDKKLIENEIKFCESLELEKNEHEQYIYESKSGKSAMNLAYILMEYKDYLIENKIVTLNK